MQKKQKKKNENDSEQNNNNEIKELQEKISLLEKKSIRFRSEK